MNVWTALVIRVNRAAVVGETVTLPCWTPLTTPVDWCYLQSESAERAWFLCSAGNIVSDYRERFTLNRSVPGDYSLVIHNVTRGDAGLYICREHQIALTVHGKISISSSCVIRLYQVTK